MTCLLEPDMNKSGQTLKKYEFEDAVIDSIQSEENNNIEIWEIELHFQIIIKKNRLWKIELKFNLLNMKKRKAIFKILNS